MIDRLVIMGDVLRPDTADASRSEATTRTAWLRDLLAPVISQVTDLPVAALTADAPPLEFGQAYRDHDIEPSVDTWASLYAGDLGPALSRRLLDACREALVIGIELPPAIARLFARHGIPAIECTVHPLRFLRDIPLAWRSTVPAIGAAIEPFGVSEFEVARAVAQIRAKARWLGGAALEPGTTLILDQLPTDAAMIDPHHGRRVTWADHLEYVATLRDAGPVLWRPHPYSRDASLLMDVLGPARMTSENFYALLTREGLATVTAISSGGVVEARAFGKRGVHLLDRDAALERDGWTASIPVIGHWLSPHFWSAVLAPAIVTAPAVPIVAPERDTFRRANNTDWDFGWIDQIVERRSAREALDADQARRLAANESEIAHLQRQVAELRQDVDTLRGHAEDTAILVARLASADRYRVRSVIDTLVREARDGAWRVGVLGAGSHTEWLVSETSLGSITPLPIFDRDPRQQGRRVAGLEVFPASRLSILPLDAIVVSSLAYEDEMSAYLESLGLPHLRIVRCYR